MIVNVLFPPSLGRARAQARAEPFADVLALGLGDEVRVEVVSTYEELERRVLANQVDLAWAPPIICARAQRTARAILTAVRGGRSTYCSAWVSRADHHLALTDLAGLRAAWVDRLSTAGYLLSVAQLRSRGSEPDRIFASQQFYGSYEAALGAVLGGEADVCAVFSRTESPAAARRTIRDFVHDDHAKLHPFAYSATVPQDGLVLTSRLPVRQGDAVLERVVRATDGSKGPTALLTLLDAERLVPAGPNDYNHLRHVLG